MAADAGSYAELSVQKLPFIGKYISGMARYGSWNLATAVKPVTMPVGNVNGNKRS